MAFGSFFKKIISGAKNLVNKAAPIVRKGLEAVQKYAPLIGDTVSKFGPVGSTIGRYINTAGSLAGKGAEYMDKTGLSGGVSGLKGRFNAPLLK